MFGLTWNNFKRFLIWTGLIKPPKGEGKYFKFYIKCHNGIALKRRMKKIWNKAFEGSDFHTAVDPSLFEKTVERGGCGVNKMDGITYFKVRKVFSKTKNCPFTTITAHDITESVLNRDQAEYRLEMARKAEQAAIDKGDHILAAQKREEVDRLKLELENPWFLTNLDDNF